jgi:serine protease inhibitor
LTKVFNFTVRAILLIRLSILTSLLISLGVGNSASAETAQSHSPVAGNTAFALDLYARLSAKPGNLFFSPFSISTCLAMTYAGARGETETQMAQVLRFNQGGARFHSSFAELLHRVNGDKTQDGPQLVAVSPQLLAQLNDAEKQDGIRLETASALWVQKGEPFLPAFLQTATDDYQAAIQQGDFKADADAVRVEINGWVARKTVNKIQNILSPGSLDARTRLILANAIYFKGAWATPFLRAITRTQPFHLSANNQAYATFMIQADRVKFTESQEFQAVELPYKGNAQSMVILLPRQIDGLGLIEKQVTPAFLDGLLAKMTTTEVGIDLPRFKIESGFELKDALASMGMTDAFNWPKADFSGINGTRLLYISKVIHKAWVEVNEEGTEAAAATVVQIKVGSAPRQLPRFSADHPFIFFIRDAHTGSLLFIGRVTDPSQ